MPSTGQIPLKAILMMLEACAPGARLVEKTHHYWVMANGLCYRNLPLGPHGHRRDVDIEVGHVRKMARYLGILDCAKTQIESL
jgi:hypothetical protein